MWTLPLRLLLTVNHIILLHYIITGKRTDNTGIRIEEWWDMFKKVNNFIIGLIYCLLCRLRVHFNGTLSLQNVNCFVIKLSQVAVDVKNENANEIVSPASSTIKTVTQWKFLHGTLFRYH